jgi:membrane protein implicated in regulation of membrane protease activity
MIPDLLVFILFISFILLLVFGSWTLRLIVITIGGSFSAWAFWTDRKMRLWPGDRVRVKTGDYKGACGVVVKPLGDGWGAQIKLERGNHLETMDFTGWYDLEKIS